VVGDVNDRACLIIDDMISTGGTMAESIEALLSAGARPEITIAATHGLFLEAARTNLSHGSVREIFVTDTVALIDNRGSGRRCVETAMAAWNNCAGAFSG
jgi:ribose-phosphate pyrophosphokinase